MFGAARRGMIGVHVKILDDEKNPGVVAARSYVTDSEGKHIENGEQKLSYVGDCGALYLDEYGKPWCMHTLLTCRSGDSMVWTSRGIMLQNIVDRHSFYFGGTPPIEGSASNTLSPTGRQSSKAYFALEKIIHPQPYGR